MEFADLLIGGVEGPLFLDQFVLQCKQKDIAVAVIIIISIIIIIIVINLLICHQVNDTDVEQVELVEDLELAQLQLGGRLEDHPVNDNLVLLRDLIKDAV